LDTTGSGAFRSTASNVSLQPTLSITTTNEYT
jgi:hypothetical protein